MKPVTALMLALLALILITVGVAAPTRATIQEEDCIDPAVEYPIPCDEDDDD
ncbi:hypothetical protein [Hyphomicrobium sp. CS1GBMeth3]|uniref:hypothetical protein n=1 Tax=Hyphomicrobium sp. CS1GBMeth3 TaxID=1892845 RepID=UPI0015C56630|nr:hypothetical protein [Hyphomicrobium sp. CS1GBMeth3]